MMDATILRQKLKIAFEQTKNSTSSRKDLAFIGSLKDLQVEQSEMIQLSVILQYSKEDFFRTIQQSDEAAIRIHSGKIASNLGLDEKTLENLLVSAASAYHDAHPELKTSKDTDRPLGSNTEKSDEDRKGLFDFLLKQSDRKKDKGPKAKDRQDTSYVKVVSANDIIVDGIDYRLVGDVLQISGKGTIHDVPREFYEHARKVVISDGIEEIGIAAFSGWQIESVDLPNSLRVIRRHAFEHCRYLWKINNSWNVRTIGLYAFNGTSIKQTDFYRAKWET